MLDTVEDYIADARTLLQDKVRPYRYDDPSLLVAFNVTLLETRRIRPDLFVFKHHDKVPAFTAVDSTDVNIEAPFRLALVYGLVGHAIARDQEEVQDSRSTMFLGAYYQILTGTVPPSLRASNPQPQQAAIAQGGR
jgi:hypothetical protein